MFAIYLLFYAKVMIASPLGRGTIRFGLLPAGLPCGLGRSDMHLVRRLLLIQVQILLHIRDAGVDDTVWLLSRKVPIILGHVLEGTRLPLVALGVQPNGEEGHQRSVDDSGSSERQDPAQPVHVFGREAYERRAEDTDHAREAHDSTTTPGKDAAPVGRESKPIQRAWLSVE